MNPAGNSSQWQQQQFPSGMAMLPDDDFSKYLEVDNIDFGFPAFDDSNIPTPNDDASQPQHHQHNLQDLDARAVAAGFAFAPSSGLRHQQQYGNEEEEAMSQNPQHMLPHRSTANGPQKGIATPLSFGAQTPYQHGQLPQSGFNLMSHQNTLQQHFSVPPTPNSAEMYPGTGSYIQHYPNHQRQKDLLGQYASHGQQAADSHTPMVSPDVMPGDPAGQNVSQYIIPGAYLSPLTSPAINPQNHPQHSFSQTHTAESSLQGSPILGISFSLATGQSNFSSNRDDSSERPKKTRRKGPALRSSTAASMSIESGTTASSNSNSRSHGNNNSQRKRRKSSLSIHVPEGKTEEHLAVQTLTAPGSTTSQSASGRSTASNTREGTRSKSVSPHALPEAHMPPPPKPPTSVGHTPTMKVKQQRPSATALPPATPASLMRLQQQQQAKTGQNIVEASPAGPSAMSPGTGDLGMSFEKLKLPDAATSSFASLIQPAPPNQRHPATGVKSPPTSAVNGSAVASVRSPTSGSIVQSSNRTPNLDGATTARSGGSSARGSRKRNSTSSSLVSPALRPKISPSIKPLLPERANGISDETHALLLASKSNYQNILEGNHLPGVVYPSELSTNLTSKRTSHKIAEQGRRNRINMAIQEMQSLLPPSAEASSEATNADRNSASNASPSDGDKTGNEKGGAQKASAAPPSNSGPAAQSNSKAATVESAIDYIKTLRSGLQERDMENEALRAEISSLRSKLGISEKSRTNSVRSGTDVVHDSTSEVATIEIDESEDSTMSG